MLPGVEYAVPMAARLAAAIDRPHLSSNAVQLVRNKLNFRNRLTQRALSEINYFTLDADQGVDAPAGFRFPAVVKPVDMADSINVRKVYSLSELSEAVNGFWRSLPHDVDFTASGRVIMEEYIPGKEYSIEGLVEKDGRIVIASITEKLLGPEPYFVEIGHIVGQVFDEAFRAMMTRYALAVVEATGLNIGPFHLELRVTPQGKPVAAELAARLPGDNIVALIIRAKGICLACATLCEYLNLPRPRPANASCVSAIAFIPRGEKRHFSKLSGVEPLLNRPEYLSHELYFTPGDALGSDEDWTSHIGYLMFAGHDAAAVRELVRQVHEEVKIA